MALNTDIPDSLNAQQVLMLRLLKNPLPDDDFQQMRRLAVKLLARKLDEKTEEWERQNQVTEDDYVKLSEGHYRLKSK